MKVVNILLLPFALLGGIIFGLLFCQGEKPAEHVPPEFSRFDTVVSYNGARCLVFRTEYLAAPIYVLHCSDDQVHVTRDYTIQ